MKGEWCYWKSYVSPEICRKIILDVQDLPSQDGLIGGGKENKTPDGHGYDGNYRRSKVKFVNKGDYANRFDYIFDIFWKTVVPSNDDFFQFHISRLNFLQFTEYDASYQGEYKEHHDVFWINNDPVYHRKISATVQLSDPNSYDGGDFVFGDGVAQPPSEDARAQGTILYFPSFIRHAVTPVTRGTRYSIVAWFEGKKWT